MQKSNREGFFGSEEEITAAFDKLEKSSLGSKVIRRNVECRSTTAPSTEGSGNKYHFTVPLSTSTSKAVLITSKDTAMEGFHEFSLSPCTSAGTTTAGTPKFSVVTPRPPLPRGVSCTIVNAPSTEKIHNTKTQLPDERLQNVNNHQQVNRLTAVNGRLLRYQTPTSNSIRNSLHPDITLTPLKSASTPVSKNSSKTCNDVSKSLQQKRPNVEAFIVCNNCKHCNREPGPCETCKTPFPSDGNLFNLKDSNVQVSNKCAPIPKKIFYGEKGLQQNSPSTEAALQNSHSPPVKVFVASDSQVPKRRGRIAKSKIPAEPECLTISSDEEDSSKAATPAVTSNPIAPPTTTQVPTLAAPVSSVIADASQVSTKIPQPSNTKAIETSTTTTTNTQLMEVASCIAHPSVTHVCHPPVNSSRLVAYSEEEGEEEEEEDEEMEMEEEEEEEEEDEEEEEEERNEEIENFLQEEMEDPEEHEEYEGHDEGGEDESEREDAHMGIPIWCRSIRIGSFKVHSTNSTFLPVYLNGDGFIFSVHTVTDVNERVTIKLRPTDIVHTLGHFGRCLPILFVYTNQGCGALIRNRLRMSKRDGPYFDPAEKDERQTRITFLIEILTDEHRIFLRHIFPGETLLREIDQKTANEILVRSTPTQQSPTKCQQDVSQAGVLAAFSQQNVIQPPAVAPSQVAPPVPSAPVVKILTYPPPPQTGGIAITSEDLLCLDEGEFLNDAIIDFYLKYLMNEKLSEADRQRTHVFSSYFYPRLTQKPGRPSAVPASAADDDEHLPSVPTRRHSQVKTWTRHVDIFEKDFIIIPINQNAHWFLAIICFPGLVPETSKLPPKPSPGVPQKSVEKVTSTNDAAEPPNLQAHCHLPCNPALQKKDQACNTEGFNGSSNSDTTVPMSTTFPQSPMIPYEHEVAEPGEPEDPLPDSSTHPDIQARKKKPCILVFDSLAGPNRWRIVSVLREYLDIEWKIKKSTKKAFDRSTMQGFVPKIPQQSNYSDCGLFVLQYVESFFEKPLPYFGSPLPSLVDWFPAEEVGKKREDIKLLISELQKRQQNAQTATSAPSTPKSTNAKPEKVPAVIVPVQAAPPQNPQNR